MTTVLEKMQAAPDTGEHIQLTDLQHTQQRGEFFLGGLAPLTSSEYLSQPNGTVILVESCRYSHAALKCADEIVVNAIDQWSIKGRDVHIWFEIDMKRGTFTIRNTGSYIPCIYKTTTSRSRIPNPQFLFAEFRTSSNYDSKDAKEPLGARLHITGGTFGFGATVVNVHCTEMTIETYDPAYTGIYRQTFRDRLSVIGPVETPAAAPGLKPYTQVTCGLDWKLFKMNDDTRLIDTFYKLLYMRARQTAVYCAPSPVYWQGTQLGATLPTQFARQFSQPYMPEGTAGNAHEARFSSKPMLIEGSARTFEWTVVIAPRPHDKFEYMTLINGVHVKTGTHVDLIRDLLLEHIKTPYMVEKRRYTGDRNAKFTNPNDILKYLFLFMRCVINAPKFNGNLKNNLESDLEEYAGQTLPKTFLDRVWEDIKPYCVRDLTNKSEKTAKQAVRRGKTKARKYTPAPNAGTTDNRCCLMIAEGDSAASMIDSLIASRGSALSRENYGIFSIQGCPVNVRKETKYVAVGGGQRRAIRSKKVLGNERITSLIAVLGLTWDRVYTRESVRGLPYSGGVIIATDQDRDGTGNIRSLIISLFQTEWPSLVALEYVKFLITPVVRAYPKRSADTVHEFTSEPLFRKWRDSVDLEDWDIMYYKGLDGHSEIEINKMAEKVNSLIITVETDKEAEDVCERYFGVDSAPRKAKLATVPIADEYDMIEDRRICISDHFDTATHSYQLCNVERHLKHILDGCTPTSRKILCGARAKFANNNKQCLVYQLTGYVSDKMGYHQGNTSADGVIIGMAQNFSGARELPLLRSISKGFGTRKKGGDDAGAARYIYTKYNNHLADALFPRADDCLLDYIMEENRQYEPRYYVPIIPVSILEHHDVPATGWKTRQWARDFDEVLAWTLESVRAGAPAEVKGDFHPSRCRLSSPMTTVGDKTYSLGVWRRISEDRILITDMPIRKWNHQLHYGKEKKAAVKRKAEDKKTRKCWNDDPNIDEVYDNSDPNMQTEIYITFRSGFLRELIDRASSERKSTLCPVIEYLGIKQDLSSLVNMILPDGKVGEFRNRYADVARMWFPYRKALYSERIARENLILTLTIELTLERLRYTRSGLRVAELAKEAQETKLREAKFAPYNARLLAKPGFTPTRNLERLVRAGPGTNLDYLLRMTDLDRNTSGIKKMESKIEECKARIRELETPDVFPGCRNWIAELESLREVVDTARRHKNGWGAWDRDHKWAA